MGKPALYALHLSSGNAMRYGAAVGIAHADPVGNGEAMAAHFMRFNCATTQASPHEMSSVPRLHTRDRHALAARTRSNGFEHIMSRTFSSSATATFEHRPGRRLWSWKQALGASLESALVTNCIGPLADRRAPMGS